MKDYFILTVKQKDSSLKIKSESTASKFQRKVTGLVCQHFSTFIHTYYLFAVNIFYLMKCWMNIIDLHLTPVCDPDVNDSMINWCEIHVIILC